jgi:hypothetical protein
MSTVTPPLPDVQSKTAYLAALESAIYRGVEYVSYGGDQIKYRSLDDMMRIRDLLRADLGFSGANRRRRPVRAIVRT